MPDEILIFGAVGTQVVVERKIFELVAIGGQGAVTWRTRCVSCHAPVFAEVKVGKLPTRARCNAHLQPSRHLEMPLVEYQHEAEIAAMSEARPPATISAEEFMPEVGVLRARTPVSQEFFVTREEGDRQRAAYEATRRGMRVVGEVKSSIEATQLHRSTPITGFVKMHMGDGDETSVEASIGLHTDSDESALVHTGGPLVLEDRDASPAHAGGSIAPGEDESPPSFSDPYSIEAQLAELEELAPDGAGDEDGPPPPLPEEDIWIPRLEKFYRDRLWHPSWGSRPDQSGCQAPQEYLDRYRMR